MSSEQSYDAPAGDAQDNDYVSRPGQKDASVPVQSDDADVESGVNPATADSDEQLEKDDNEAIDKDNIVDSRTRGAAPEKGAYTEPGDEEGLQANPGMIVQ